MTSTCEFRFSLKCGAGTANSSLRAGESPSSDYWLALVCWRGGCDKLENPSRTWHKGWLEVQPPIRSWCSLIYFPRKGQGAGQGRVGLTLGMALSPTFSPWDVDRLHGHCEKKSWTTIPLCQHQVTTVVAHHKSARFAHLPTRMILQTQSPIECESEIIAVGTG